MSVVLELSPQEEAEARRRAERAGITVTELFRRYLHSPSSLSGRTFQEMTDPLREDFQASGMSDEELDEFVGQLVDQARSELSVEKAAR
jgi:hypothetical protein